MSGTHRGVRLEEGTRVSGDITRIGRDDLFIDLGLKSEGRIHRSELPEAQIGDRVDAWVIIPLEHGPRLSTKLTGAAAEAQLAEAAETGATVTGSVQRRNRGGYEVRFGSVQAFCPVSQMDRHIHADPDVYLGQELDFRVIEHGDRVIVSRRALLEEDLAERQTAFWASASVGDEFDGIVASVQVWGAFVEIAGVDGLMPKREFSWTNVSDLTACLSRGDSLRVRILELDHDAHKMTLSARDPSQDPWGTVVNDFTVGAVVPGRVVSNTDFGVFVEVAPGLQGLIHSSRAGKERPEVDSTLDVRIGSIDRDRQRLELVPADYEAPVETRPETGIEVQGTVQKVHPNGLTIVLDDGARAWLPEADVPRPPGTLLAQRYRRGRTLTARIASYDTRRGQVVLTMREEEQSDWRQQIDQSSSGSSSMGTLGDLLGGLKLS
jgi:small subunit ribosomal protein S1